MAIFGGRWWIFFGLINLASVLGLGAFPVALAWVIAMDTGFYAGQRTHAALIAGVEARGA